MQKVADELAGVYQFVEVDAGVHAHAVQHVDHVFGRHIAGRALGIGTAPQPRHGGVELPDTHLQAGQGVGQGLAIGVVEMARHVVDIVVLQGGFHGALHLARCAHAYGVGHTDMLHADVLHQAGQHAHAFGRDLALVRATHGARHGATHTDALDKRGGHHRTETLDALRNRAIDIALAESLTGSGEHHNLLRPELRWRGYGRLEALQIRREHRIPHARAAPDAGHHLAVVGHLRHPFRAHETRDLDFLQPGVLQAVHEFDLDIGRDGLLFVLQAVARANVYQFDNGGESHGFSNLLSICLCISAQ